jgi:exopolysaccharide biosynthesis WecB/TagA/CpsF family protein
MRIIRNSADLSKYSIVFYINLFNYRGIRNYLGNENIGFTFDGISFTLIFRILYLKRCERLSPDYTGYLNHYLADNRIHVYGSGKIDLERFVRNNSRLNIISSTNGFEPVTVFMNILKKNAIKGDIVLVGRGSPLQEQTIMELVKSFPDLKYVAVGAFITQFSNGSKYYPLFIDKLNLRWLYRLLNEQLYSRIPMYLKGLLSFVSDILLGRIKYRN